MTSIEHQQKILAISCELLFFGLANTVVWINWPFWLRWQDNILHHSVRHGHIEMVFGHTQLGWAPLSAFLNATIISYATLIVDERSVRWAYIPIVYQNVPLRSICLCSISTCFARKTNEFTLANWTTFQRWFNLTYRVDGGFKQPSVSSKG